MQNFHIYDAIGRGKRCVVYKGRRKRTVEWVAIKSTDRDQKASVLLEVKALHAASHPNILRFHSWYETTNHLWLILEYCVGGDLGGLLRSDRRVAEAALAPLARQLAATLLYLHSIGMLHCDLRPGNVLLDENGSPKLSGFSHAKRIADVSAVAAVGGKAAARPGGRPHYWAPELFAPGGAPHSSASDLWALGCLLYECAAGRPPFNANSLSALAASVASAEPAALQGVPLEFRRLVGRLLDKDPATRMGWEELCGHAYWGAEPLPLRALPAEPALAAYLAASGGAGGKENAGRAPPAGRGGLAPGLSGSLGDDQLQGADSVLDAFATPAHPSSSQRRAGGGAAATAAQHLDFEDGPAGAAGLHRPPGPRGSADAAPKAALPEALVWHPTDAAMKPIVGNRRIERPVDTGLFNPATLPFSALAAAELVAMPPPSRSGFLQTALDAFTRGTDATKAAALAYFESLCPDAQAANELVNSGVAPVLVLALAQSMGGHSAGSPLTARLAYVIGLMVRHAAVIQDALAHTGVVDVLARGLADPDAAVQRRCMAALGELLFYCASQQRDEQAAAASAWQISQGTLSVLLRMLGQGVDDVAQHYAAKTIENICGLSGAIGQRLATAETLAALYRLAFSAGDASSALRGTAASALARIAHLNPGLLPAILEAGRVALCLRALTDSSQRVQQAAATLLCELLAFPAASPGALALILADTALHPGLSALLESQSDVLRAKGMVLAALLVRHGGARALSALSSGRLLHQLERVQVPESGEAYLKAAAAALQESVAAAVAPLLQQISSGVAVLVRQGPAGSLSQGLVEIQVPALLALLSSSAFRPAVVTDALITSLAEFLTSAVACTAAGPELEQLKGQVLQAIDAVCSHAELLVVHHTTVLKHLLPALSAAVASSTHSIDARFVCLKLLCDVVLQYLAEPQLYSPGAAAGRPAQLSKSGEGRGEVTELINAAVVLHALPLMPALLEDDEPMPLYALKMLGVLLSVNSSWVATIAELGIAARFIEWLSIDHPHNNVHNIRICRVIIEAGALAPGQLSQLRAFDRALEILEYAWRNEVGAFLEPALELALALLQQGAASEQCRRAMPVLQQCCGLGGASASAAAACLEVCRQRGGAA